MLRTATLALVVMVVTPIAWYPINLAFGHAPPEALYGAIMGGSGAVWGVVVSALMPGSR